jgi:hypothetical protein
MAPTSSVFNRQALPDFVDPLVERIEPGVKGPVVKVEDVASGEKSENPVMAFHVHEYQLDRVTDRNNDVPQNVHRIPRTLRKQRFLSWAHGSV